MTDRPLRVAIATTFDPGVVLRRLQETCEAIEGLLERPATGHLMVAYDELAAGAERDDFDVMWLPPWIALQTVPAGLARALAVPIRGGSGSYGMALFTRPDADVSKLDDLRGKRVGWVDPHSSAGHLLPRALLASEGIDPDGDLGEQRMLGSHARVVRAVLEGDVDAGATYATVIDGEVTDGAWGKREVRVLAHRGPIPADLIATGRGLEDDERETLREQLVERPDSTVAERFRSLLRCEAFEEVDDSHLEPLKGLLGSAADG